MANKDKDNKRFEFFHFDTTNVSSIPVYGYTLIVKQNLYFRQNIIVWITYLFLD
jgi:hypothetical protein